MQVNGTTGASQTNSYSSSSSTSTSGTADTGLMATQFMQILMAEITHQDPLEPMSNSEMLTQFSQLNSLQELQQIHAALTNAASSNQAAYLATLIGKTVKAGTSDGGTVNGVVHGVIPDSENPQLLIGDSQVNLGDVLEIQATTA